MRTRAIEADAGRPRKARLQSAYVKRLVGKALTQNYRPSHRAGTKVAQSLVKVTRFRHNTESVSSHVKYLVRYRDPMHMDDGQVLHGRETIMANFRDSFEPRARPPTPKMREALERVSLATGHKIGNEERGDIRAAARWLDEFGAPSKRGKWVDRPERVAMSMLLGAPKGSDPDRLRVAAQEFGRGAFGDDYRWGFVIHTNTETPHAHFVVATRSHTLHETLQVDRKVLREWRSLYAMEASNAGIPMTSARWYEKDNDRPQFAHTASPGSYRAHVRGDVDERTAHLLRTFADVTYDINRAARAAETARTIAQGDVAAERVRHALRRREADRTPSGPPTIKALKHAERIARRQEIEIPSEARGDARLLSAFISENKPPTPRKLKALERLAPEALETQSVKTAREVERRIDRASKGPSEATQERISAALGLPPTPGMMRAVKNAESDKLRAPSEAFVDAGVARAFLNEHGNTKLPAWLQGKNGRTEGLASELVERLRGNDPLSDPIAKHYLARLGERTGRSDLVQQGRTAELLDATMPGLAKRLMGSNRNENEGR